MSVLTAIDLVGIQRFVFSSNRLRDVVGGSHLVKWALDGALDEGGADPGATLLAAGGNGLLRFDDLPQARAFAGRYSRLLLEKAPGLDAVIAHHQYEPGGLAAALDAVSRQVERERVGRPPSAPLLGLSITQPCRETGLVARAIDPGPEAGPVSDGILARRRCSPTRDDARFPRDLDDMGRTHGDISMMGVAHIDGNGVGRKIVEWSRAHVERESPDAQVEAEIREWSGALGGLIERVEGALLERLEAAVVDDGTQPLLRASDGTTFPLAQRGGRPLLPYRPILAAGDDITFVCDSRVALDLAVTALDVFAESGTLPYLGRIGACAGVAIVRTHFPFARAYRLAEELCASAKRGLRAEPADTDGCAIDWHVGAPPPGISLEDLRARHYRARDGSLATFRPYRLRGGPIDWKWLSQELLGPNGHSLRGPSWRAHRGRMKSLGELVREGPARVEKALEGWRRSTPGLELPPPIDRDGFRAGRTPLLDAIELLDLHADLDSQAGES